MKKDDPSGDLSGTGFQPVNPWKTTTVVTRRRNLPHVEVPAATYFVTFRLHKGLTLSDQARTAVLDAIKHWDGTRIELDAAVVLPSHIHLILRIIDQSSLGQVLHSIKSFSAKSVNKLLHRSGTVWMDESFDHIIRDGQDLDEKTEYVRMNPVKAGLVDNPMSYRWLVVKTTG